MNTMPFFIFTLASFVLWGCAQKDSKSEAPAPKSPESSGTISGYDYDVVEGGTLSLTTSTVTGNGQIIFRDTLASVQANKKFSLDFAINDEGRLDLFSHAEESLRSGVQLTIARSNNKTTISSGEFSKPLEFELPKEVKVVVQVQNDRQDFARLNLKTSSGNTLLNSEESHWSIPLGKGTRFGIGLENVLLTSFAVSDADASEHEGPAVYTTEHLHQTAVKATNRFERLAIPGSKLKSVKTWKSTDYVWARLTYTVSDNPGPTDEALFLACHFHGSELGCHKKDVTDPSEPLDRPEEEEIPSIEEELADNLNTR